MKIEKWQMENLALGSWIIQPGQTGMSVLLFFLESRGFERLVSHGLFAS